MTSPKLDHWRQHHKHLPPFLRDFHDQKALFKAIEEAYGHEREKPGHVQMPDWVTAQCYTIDWFLWFMAKHGYTLQRSQADVPFDDIAETLKAHEQRQYAALREIFGKKPAAPLSTPRQEGQAGR